MMPEAFNLDNRLSMSTGARAGLGTRVAEEAVLAVGISCAGCVGTAGESWIVIAEKGCCMAGCPAVCCMAWGFQSVMSCA